MAIDPQRMASLMQNMQGASPSAPPGGGMMAPQGVAPGAPSSGVVNSKISGTVIMAPAEGQQGGPPAPVQLEGTVRMSKSNAGGPPNMMHIEGEVMVSKPNPQAGAASGMAPQGAPLR